MSPRIWVRGITFAATAFLLLPPAFTQTKGTTSSTTGTTTGSTGTTGASGRTFPPPDSSTTSGNTAPVIPPAPVMVSGRVLLEEGTPPAESALIERVCYGNTHAEGYTDSRGYFVLQLGQSSGQIPEASESGGNPGRVFTQMPGSGSGGLGSGMGGGRGSSLADNRFMGCEIRARLPGFRSQTVSLMDHRALDNPDIGVILLHRLAPADGTTVNASSLAAPKPAQKVFSKAMDLLKKQKSEEAEGNFRKAVELYPNFAAAWVELGKMQAVDGHLDEARKSFNAAIAAEPRFVAPYLELSALAAHDKNWTELVQSTDHVLKLDSFEYPQAYFWNAVANYNLRNYKMAEQHARAAKRLDTRHMYPQAAHLLGVLLSARHEYTAAADELRDYLVMAPHATDATEVRKQLDDLEKRTIPAAQVAAKNR